MSARRRRQVRPHKKTPSPRSLQLAYAYGPRAVLVGGRFHMSGVPLYCWCFLRRRAALAPNISRRGSYFLSWAERHPRFKVLVPCVRSPPTVARSLSRLFPHHPGGNPGANLKSISHRCYLFEVAFA